jgi:hypothetical protein
MSKVVVCLCFLVFVACGAAQEGSTPEAMRQAITSDEVPADRCPCDICPNLRTCTGSCFEENALILTQGFNGTFEWIPASKVTSSSRLGALEEKSAITVPEIRTRAIKTILRTWTSSPIYTFSLDNGHQLKVTSNHPMLLSEGRVVAAGTIKIGAKFKSLDGSIVQVNNISIEEKEQYVYNFEVEAAGAMGHIIAAEGVLVGDLAWQNKLTYGD